MAPKMIGFGAKTRRQKKMAPKLKFGAKPGAKSGAKFGTKRGAKWCFGAKLDNAIMLHRPSVSLHRARRYRSQSTALAYGSTLSAYCCKGASIWLHLASISLPGTSISLPRACISQHHASILHINANG